MGKFWQLFTGVWVRRVVWVSQWPTLCIPSATSGPNGTNKYRCGLNSLAVSILVPSMDPAIQSVTSMAPTPEEKFRM